MATELNDDIDGILEKLQLYSKDHPMEITSGDLRDRAEAREAIQRLIVEAKLEAIDNILIMASDVNALGYEFNYKQELQNYRISLQSSLNTQQESK